MAGLAHLRLDDQEVSRMAHDLDEILTHVDKLNELDTTGVEPMAQVLFEADPTSTLRQDTVGQCLPNESALANAPLAGSGQFKVPRVIER